jgi:hypothetical protein
MPSANRNNLLSCFQAKLSFISFSCLTALAQTFSIILNRGGKSGHSCLVQTFSLSSLSMTYSFSHSININGETICTRHRAVLEDLVVLTVWW